MRVRFAPSPTGYLHIGGARTALLNYLFVRKNQGKFILRIEDTDTKRSSNEMSKEIIRGLKWLGMEWDEGPYFQSADFEKYKKYARILKDKKLAYNCYCKPEEIEERKKKKGIYKYDRKCLNLTDEEEKKYLKEGRKPVLRFLVPKGQTVFKDKIHKKMQVNNEEIEDFVLLKSDGLPTYHLSVVVDDYEMNISHILRGDDHLSNTFKQIMLYLAFGFKIPVFYHLPLILGKDRKKLSKRHGETSITEFKRLGYLPEAFLTYLAQLSWNPGDYKKIFFLNDLIRDLDFTKLSKNSPEFDYDKLRFLNSRAIMQKPAEKLLTILENSDGFLKDVEGISKEKRINFINLIKPRMKTLNDIKEKFSIYFNNDFKYSDENIKKVVKNNKSIKILENLIGELNELKNFDSLSVENAIRNLAEKLEIKAGELIHPCRLAITYEIVSPGIFEIFEFFGKDESIRRIKNFIERLKNYVFSD